MTLLALGRCPFPEAAYRYAVPVDESDCEVIERSVRLPAGVFHGLVELVVAAGGWPATLRALEAGGWKEYDPPRGASRYQRKPAADA